MLAKHYYWLWKTYNHNNDTVVMQYMYLCQSDARKQNDWLLLFFFFHFMFRRSEQRWKRLCFIIKCDLISMLLSLKSIKQSGMLQEWTSIWGFECTWVSMRPERTNEPLLCTKNVRKIHFFPFAYTKF